MKLYDLKTNHQFTPVIDTIPYFSWRIASGRQNTLQKSYRIIVESEDEILWDSAEVVSREQCFVPYQGKPLASRRRYVWHLSVCDDGGEHGHADGHFTTAFLSPSDWVAKWAECPFTREPANEYRFGNAYPAVLFERTFLLSKEIRRATVYATSYGVYRLRINQKRPDDREFSPEFTPYEKTLYYQTYDVTNLLRRGENVLSMFVGDGWYFSTQAGPVRKEKRAEPSVLFQLEIEYADGAAETIASDEHVTCRKDYIVYSDLYQGEKQDYTFGDFERYPALIKNYGYGFLRAQPTAKISAIRRLSAKRIFVTPKGETIVDFGQVIAGRAVICIDIPRGETAVFEYFEELDSEGNYINTMFAPQKDTFVSGGVPIEYEALFTFHGFRYIRVSGDAILHSMRKEDYTALLLSTEKEDRGDFVCSDERLNRLYQNIRFSQFNNMMSVPTDCPTREKAGWTGDILIYAKTAMMNEDMTPFLSAWLGSVRDDQDENGVITIVSPYMKLYDGLLRAQTQKFGDDGLSGVAGWSDAIVWVPFDMYRVTGNTAVLSENYAAMARWTEYIVRTAKTRCGDSGIPKQYDEFLWNTGFHFGEWLVPSRPLKEGEASFDACPETAYYIAPFFGYMTVKKMSEIAAILNKKSDEALYANIAQKMKDAIQNGIMRAGRMPEKYMGAYILAFAFDLVPNDLKEAYRQRLIDMVEANGCKLDTGFLATPFILDVLCDLNRSDLAFRVLFATERPSWLYEVTNGATAIWESWDADDAKRGGRYASYDHYAFGCVDDFICRRICGIDSDTAGFSHMVIAPDTRCGLSFCRRMFLCEAGRIFVEWDKDTLNVSIPSNTTASVLWKGKKYEIGSGDYTFGEADGSV